jgi:polyhydroxyalkanoate synthesis regulator phasin
MIETMVACSLAALAAVLLALATPDGERLTRRAALRLVIWGASGLSLLPGCLLRSRQAQGGTTVTCYAPPPPPPDPDQPTSLLGKWARLGRIWREMSVHLRGKAYDPEGEAEFNELKTAMGEALDALPASPELREVFEQRWAHIHRAHYVPATCYEMMMGGAPPARDAVEEQVKELEELVAEGKLTRETARKAAEALGVQAEYYMRLRKIEAQTTDDESQKQWELRTKLWEQYEADEIVPGVPAELAGKRLAELTADALGLLAGDPQENEGMDATEENGQAEEADPVP